MSNLEILRLAGQDHHAKRASSLHQLMLTITTDAQHCITHLDHRANGFACTENVLCALCSYSKSEQGTSARYGRCVSRTTATCLQGILVFCHPSFKSCKLRALSFCTGMTEAAWTSAVPTSCMLYAGQRLSLCAQVQQASATCPAKHCSQFANSLL